MKVQKQIQSFNPIKPPVPDPLPEPVVVPQPQKVLTEEQMRERYALLRPRYLADGFDVAQDRAEVEQLAVELNDYHQLMADRAESRTLAMYARNTLGVVDPSIYGDMK
jgi:hypothetical protein